MGKMGSSKFFSGVTKSSGVSFERALFSNLQIYIRFLLISTYDNLKITDKITDKKYDKDKTQ